MMALSHCFRMSFSYLYMSFSYLDMSSLSQIFGVIWFVKALRSPLMVDWASNNPQSIDHCSLIYYDKNFLDHLCLCFVQMSGPKL